MNSNINHNNYRNYINDTFNNLLQLVKDFYVAFFLHDYSLLFFLD